MKIFAVVMLISMLPLTIAFYVCMVLSAYYLIRYKKYELTQEKMDETSKAFWLYMILVIICSGISGMFLQTVFG